jgi:hypothetical protein
MEGRGRSQWRPRGSEWSLVGQCFGSESGLDPGSESGLDPGSESGLDTGSESGLDPDSIRSVDPYPNSEYGSGIQEGKNDPQKQCCGSGSGIRCLFDP